MTVSSPKPKSEVSPLNPKFTPSDALALLIVLLTVLTVSSVVALALGPTRIPVDAVVRALFFPLTHRASDLTVQTIVWQIRLPRIVLAALVGGSLGVAGLAFQALLRNDLAEPYTTGVSAGASVGAGFVIVFGLTGLLQGLLLPLCAFVGAIGVLLFIMLSARRGGKVDVRAMLLMGVVASAFLWAVQMLLLRLAGKNTDEILGWLMGTLSNASWRDCALILPFSIVGVAVLARQTYAMNLFAVGEITAQQLGLDVERFKRSVVASAALLTAASVAVAGIVAFVGLVVPHIARRMLRTPDHRYVLPVTVLCGMLMMIWSDTAARLLFGGDRVPVGVVTAFWGGPFFWHLLKRERR